MIENKNGVFLLHLTWILRYLFLSETFSVNSKWLMHTTIQLLENYSLEVSY